jgi:hypothetical protein
MGVPPGGTVTSCGCFINGPVLPDTTPNVPFASAGTPPNDLNSVIQSIIQLQLAVKQLTNQLGNLQPVTLQNYKIYNGGFNSSNNQQNQKKPPKQKPLGFIQLSRQTEQVKVTNPDNPNQFVMVNQTKQLVMQDKDSGDLWTWNLDN